jgi:AraC-like DNA-binding protein
MAEQQTEWLTRRPAPALARVVERYVGYRLSGLPAGVHRGLPSRHMTFIVSIGPEIDVIAQTDAAQAPDRYRCVLSGLQASHVLVAHDGNQEGVAIELTPVGCRALFGLPAAALWNTSLELADVAGPLGVELWERLQGAATWDERFGVVDTVLGRVLRDDPLEPALRRAWQLVACSGGTAAVGDIARTIGWTRQHFSRRFAAEFGLTPKLAARVARFDRARRMISSTPPLVSIAQVAAVCGYYDQAHLTRDFVALAGSSPGRLGDGDLPSFQDPDAVDPRP